MQLRKIIIGLVLILTCVNVAQAQGLRCNEIENNKWSSRVNANWEEGVKEFREVMDKEFASKIKHLNNSAQGFECHASVAVFQTAGFGVFSKKVLEETQMLQCALLDEYRNINVATIDTENVARKEIYKSYNSRQEAIAQEMENISISVRLALDALSQQQFAYALHQRFSCIITNLEKMRDGLKDFGDQAVRIPAKFINCGYEK